MSNQLTRIIRQEFIPVAALLAYKAEEGEYNEPQYRTELREIKNNKMTEALPVTYEFTNAIAKNYIRQNESVPFGKIPSNLLYYDPRQGSKKIVWYNLPTKRVMHFDKKLCIPSTDYFVPGVVYVVENEKMNIYAFKGSEINEETKLYYGPFFNVTYGSVCLGKATLKLSHNPTYNDLLLYWEKKFWNTTFTHLGGGTNPTRSNLVTVTKKAQTDSFDEAELKPAKITLQKLLK